MSFQFYINVYDADGFCFCEPSLFIQGKIGKVIYGVLVRKDQALCHVGPDRKLDHEGSHCCPYIMGSIAEPNRVPSYSMSPRRFHTREEGASIGFREGNQE
jgi:hypothetical protein